MTMVLPVLFTKVDFFVGGGSGEVYTRLARVTRPVCAKIFCKNAQKCASLGKSTVPS